MATKKSRRTVLYSSAGKKLYAVRDKTGKFKDIQQYSRAHRMDMARKSKEEAAGASAAKQKTAKKAAKKVARKVAAKKTAAPAKGAASSHTIGSGIMTGPRTSRPDRPALRSPRR